MIIIALLGITAGTGVVACAPPPVTPVPSSETAPSNPAPAETPVLGEPVTIPTIPIGTPTAPIETPTTTPCPTPMGTSTLTINLEPWKTDRGYEAETGSLGYDAISNSIQRWGTDNSDPARMKKAERVYQWLCDSGGYWGTGCPGEETVAAWLLFEEGGVLYVPDQYNMLRGIHYRFGRWGFNSFSLSAYTAFLNPERDDVFDDTDWKALTSPNTDMSNFKQITKDIYAVPYTELDGRYLYWFDESEMQKVNVREADLKRLGPYTKTNRVDGLPFYFTGIPNVFRCGTQGGNTCHP